MTAPQHDEATASQQGNSHSNQPQKLQRCWFITLGLLGGFGFVTSQMNFAIAQNESLTTDYTASDLTADSDVSATSSTTENYTGQNYSLEPANVITPQPAFEIVADSQPAPVPEAFIDAPAVPMEAAASFAAPAFTAAPASTPPTAASAAEKPAEASVQTATQTATQTAASTSSVSYHAQALGNPSISGAERGFRVSPAVSSAESATFTSPQKLATSKTTTDQTYRLAGMMDAGAVAAPVSAYAMGQANRASANHQAVLVSDARAASNAAELTVAVADETAIEAPASAAEAAPVVVPEILPPAPAAPVEPATPAAPPIVDAPVVNPEQTAESAPVQPTEIVPAALPEGTNLPEEYNDIFVDPTDYSIGATEVPDIMVSEEATGCEFTVGQGGVVPNGACGSPAAPAPVAADGGQYEAPVANTPDWQQPSAPAPVASAPAVNVGPVSFSASGIQLSTSVAGREYLNRSVRPLVNLQASEQFIFPLAIPSPITSLFGFRIHPITGDYRFHAGTDIGAEQGTPVLAAQSGVVTTADYAGGYGLMVVLQHDLEETELESRYAHLAEIFVEPGTEVSKGDIIGLVGSTGNSTGPHLHFEMRQLTADGWVPVNADNLVQTSLANLVKALNDPMAAISFNLSDFNLSNLRAGGSLKAPSSEIPTFPGGQGSIPFRPAQPNAS